MTNHWRQMLDSDLPTVKSISDAVHGSYTEDKAIYAERLALYPFGCQIFERDGISLGYFIAHPWRHEAPPPLNAKLGALPADADVYYLHDIALLPAARGNGGGKAAIARVVKDAIAGGFERIRLVAINGAVDFWVSQGFTHLPNIGSYGAETYLMQRSL